MMNGPINIRYRRYVCVCCIFKCHLWNYPAGWTKTQSLCVVQTCELWI